jgi:pilus assembly protein CpaC
MLAVSGAMAPSSADTINPNNGPIRLSVPLSEQDRLHNLEIERGKSIAISTDYAVKRISVGAPEILDVVAIGTKDIQLVAKSIGITNVLLWDTKGRPQAIIEVHVGTPYTHVERTIRRIMHNDSILVEGAGNAVILRGNVSSSVGLDQVLKLAHGMIEVGEGEDTPQVVNLIEVGGNHQVMLSVIVAEMSRKLKREFGTNFAALIATGKGPVGLVGGFGGAAGLTEAAAGLGKIFGSFSSLGALKLLEFAMDILEEEGLSKILARPTLVARSGESANFLVGGEVPIPVVQSGAVAGAISVEYHEFGVGLSFTPTVLAPDRIHITVNPEVSRADFTFGTEVNGTLVPGFATRRASTSVELADGQSFMIAGLLNEEIREIVGKYPLLGSLPILGSLFRSTQFIKEETELVIIVTPTLVKPLGPGPHPLPTDHFIEPSAAEFYLWGTLEGMPPENMKREIDHQFEAEGMIGDTGNRITTSFEGGAQ